MLECNLNALNTSFIKRTGKLWTHISPIGARNQIDFILINNKWKNSALNCEAYNTFCTVGSDHRIVTAKIRLSLRQSKPSSKKRCRYNWNTLLTDYSIKDKYTIEVRNQYQVLQGLGGNKDATQMYNDIMSAHNKAAKASVPVKAKVKHGMRHEKMRTSQPNENR
mgnify:CR=1 FL=1